MSPASRSVTPASPPTRRPPPAVPSKSPPGGAAVLLRRLARPLFASWFVSEGLDVVRHPAAHAAEARGALTTLRGRLPQPVRQGPAGEALGRPLTDRQLTTIVQVHGAALAGAGILLV